MLLTSSCLALPAISPLAKPQQELKQKQAVLKLANLLNHAKRHPITNKQLSTLATSNISLNFNGSNQAKGITQVQKYLQTSIDTNKITNIHIDKDELIVAGNNVVAHYYYQQKIQGHWQQQQIMANFNFNTDGKIQRWSEVSEA